MSKNASVEPSAKSFPRIVCHLCEKSIAFILSVVIGMVGTYGVSWWGTESPLHVLLGLYFIMFVPFQKYQLESSFLIFPFKLHFAVIFKCTVSDIF